MTPIRKLIDLTKPYWSRVLLGILFGFGVSGLTGSIAWLVKPAIDTVLMERRYEYFAIIPLGAVLLIVLKGVFEFGQTYLMRSAAFRIIRDTQDRLHRHFLHIPIRYFHAESSGVIISRVTNDVRMLGAIFSEVLRTFLIQIPTIAILLGVAMYRKWDLTLLSITLVPLIVVGTRKFGKRIKKRSFEAQVRTSRVTHRLSESISGAKIVRVFNRQSFRDSLFVDENRRVYRENMRIIRLKEITKVMIDLATGLAIAGILWYGGTQVMAGGMTPGDFVSAVIAVYLLFVPVKKVGEAYTLLQEINAAIERVDKVFAVETEDTKGTLSALDGFRREIRFNDVSFAYTPESPLVLKHIDLTVRHGEHLAIVGPSGAGKSTLCDLVPRFYNPSEGSITIDGIDLRQVELSSLRSLIGIVSQDIILFDDTITDNIAFGNDKADFEEIRRAAEMAYASEFIERLPDRYETVIGERGVMLSGGQRQRLAIARAILKNPPILILDEATSSLDKVSESLVQKALDSLMANRTTIVIAHRLSTIQHADRIIVLKDGEIRDSGTHEELLAGSQLYAKLWNDISREAATPTQD